MDRRRFLSSVTAAGGLAWAANSQAIAETAPPLATRVLGRSGIERDPNLAFPLDRLRELAREGKLGAPMDRHFSFMGSITAPGQLMRDTAPDVAAKLREDGADWVLLTPV